MNQDSREGIEDILKFWFGGAQTATEIAAEKNPMWWSKQGHIDQEITRRFAATTEAAVSGQLDHWSESARGLLALVICADQFPRNMYRDTPKAFSYDFVALNFSKQCVDSGADHQLKPIERVFVYLPFEHSEALIEQTCCLSLYQTLAASADPNEAELFNGYCKFASKHYQVIKRFGRFPHRNKILARPSTDEELAFLEQPGSSF